MTGYERTLLANRRWQESVDYNWRTLADTYQPKEIKAEKQV